MHNSVFSLFFITAVDEPLSPSDSCTRSRFSFSFYGIPLTMIRDTPYVGLELEQHKCVAFNLAVVYFMTFFGALFWCERGFKRDDGNTERCFEYL